MIITKKTISFLLLSTTLFFGSFYDFAFAAGPLSVSTASTSINTGQQVSITASFTVSSGMTPGNVFFSVPQQASGYQLSPNFCTLSAANFITSTCSVNFLATTAGSYILQATTTVKNQNGTNTPYTSNSLQITVKQAAGGVKAQLLGTISPAGTIAVGQTNVSLKVQTSPTVSGTTIMFSSSTPGVLSQVTCITDLNGGCSVPLSVGAAGTFTINYSTADWVNTSNTQAITGSATVGVLNVVAPPTLNIQTECNDGKDNDGDGLIDSKDPGCHDDGNANNPQSYDVTLSEGILYNLLTPLPCDSSLTGCVNGKLTSFSPDQTNALSVYLNIVIRTLIGIAAVLAVIMIVMGGIEYMTSELISSKEEGRHRITNAVIGLLIALGAYLILYTINPNLLKTIDVSDNSQFSSVSVAYTGDPEGTKPYVPISQSVSPASFQALQNMGIYCPGSGGVNSLPQIAQSFIGKVTYNNDLRGTIGTNPATVYLDCSSFVDQVYACAGLSNPGSYTGAIFNSKTPVPTNADGTLNVSALHIGDLVGWTNTDTGTKYGHVLMYIGNSTFIDSEGHGHVTNASVTTTTSVKSNIRWINPAP